MLKTFESVYHYVLQMLDSGVMHIRRTVRSKDRFEAVQMLVACNNTNAFEAKVKF